MLRLDTFLRVVDATARVAIDLIISNDDGAYLFDANVLRHVRLKSNARCSRGQIGYPTPAVILARASKRRCPVAHVRTADR